MYTKKFLIDSLQETKAAFDELIKIISDFDQSTLDHEIESYFEILMMVVSFNLCFTSELFMLRVRGLPVERLLESFEDESIDLLANPS